MSGEVLYNEIYPIIQGDFIKAGEASSKIKKLLKQLGIPSNIVRMMSIVSYEIEMNLIIHSLGGTITLAVAPDQITLLSQDVGPGIPNIDLAMKEGYSTAPESVRTMGFGAGMGLPNIKRNAHHFRIESSPGAGTTILTAYDLPN